VQVKNILEKDFSENIGEVKILEIGEFPLFNQDMENNFPEVVTNFKKEIESSDKIIFITPEYNRSIPGVLKNAIDWASRRSARGACRKSFHSAGARRSS
jgi:NAD(P)H-dependent FMN reductase